MEVNKINDNELKEQLANIAISVLTSGGFIKQEDLAGTRVDFGYVFLKASGNVEALYRLILPNGAAHYFAAQDDGVSHIMLDEEMYNDTIARMREYHPCLKENN